MISLISFAHSSCTSDYCNNAGICEVNQIGLKSCKCVANYFEGKRCDKPTNNCEDVICAGECELV